MITKVINVNLHQPIYERLTAKQGDIASRYLLFHLLDGDKPFDLTGRSVRVYAIKPDKTEIFNDLTINDASKGYCTLELTSQCLASAGVVKMELYISESGKVLTSIPFELEVIACINTANGVTSTNEFSALEAALGSLQDYDNLRREIIQARKGHATVGKRLDNFDTQLDTKAKQTDLETTNTRIDNLIIHSGEGTDKDAEVVDGRVGANSTTYTTIGENIRDIAKANGILNKSISPYKTNFISYDDIMSQDGIVVGAINSVGSMNSEITTANTSTFLPVEEGMEIEIPGKIAYLAYYNINKVSLVSSLGRLSNLNNYKGVIPTYADKVKYIRITWSNEASNENYRNPLTINIFKADKIKLLKPFKDNSIDLSVIKGSEDLKNENDIYFTYDAYFKVLTIYMKTIAENTYLGYRLRRMTAEYDASNSSSNCDIWRLRGVGVYTKDGNTFTDILTDGLVHEGSEWECAIKETGMPDFSGGSTHGDEFIDSIVFMLDGVVYTDPTQFSTKTCKELRIIRKSKLYRANTNSETYIADHYVDYLFKNNEIVIDNRVDWKVDTNCGISYLCMLGAKRFNGTTQVTNKAIKQGDGSVLDVSIEGHTNNGTTKRCTKAYLWNDGSNGGVNVNMSIEILENNFFPNFNFKFDNRAEYNKFYFDQCGSNFEVKTGDIWFNKAKYKIDYLGEY